MRNLIYNLIILCPSSEHVQLKKKNLIPYLSYLDEEMKTYLCVHSPLFPSKLELYICWLSAFQHHRSQVQIFVSSTFLCGLNTPCCTKKEISVRQQFLVAKNNNINEFEGFSKIIKNYFVSCGIIERWHQDRHECPSMLSTLQNINIDMVRK
jgi:hypothetical protein